MQSAKEAAANIAASAQSGLDKTKAVVQEKVDKMTAPNPIEKQLATERKEQKIQNAEITKQATYQQNAAMAHGAPHAPHTVGGPGPYAYSTTTTTGATTGGHQMSALPGHGTGQPLVEGTTQSHPIGTGQPLVEGNAQSHPIGTVTGTEGPAPMTGQHNTHVGGPGPYSFSTTGATTGEHQMSALPGHGTGQQPLVEGTTQSHPIGTGQPLAEGTAQSHPIGTATGTERPAPMTGHNTHAGGGTGTGYGTGTGGYSG